MISSFLKRLSKRASHTDAAGGHSRQPAELFANDEIRISTLGDPNAPNVFLCFTGIRQAMGGIGAEEFVGSASIPGYSALFISDLKRSWFNSFEPSLLQEVLAERTSGRNIITIGNSMGGYGAIWATAHFRVKTAIAFAPQFSVHPDIVPSESRWMEFRKDIKGWRNTSLAESFNHETRYFTINGSYDELHWSEFPHQENCEHFVIANSAHNPAAILKEAGVLSDALSHCIRGTSPFRTIQDAGVDCQRI